MNADAKISVIWANLQDRLSKPVTIGQAILVVLVISLAAGSAQSWQFFVGASQSRNGFDYPIPAALSKARPKLDCGDQIYSPVQNACVSRAIFDQEMQRLFDALGIETSIYRLNSGRAGDH